MGPRGAPSSPPAEPAGQGLPALAEVLDTARRLEGIVRRTPLVPSATLSALLRRPVYLKLENLQVTGSFKVRGAVAALAALGAAERTHGVITASAGNHGLGCAWAAGQAGCTATVVVPEGAVVAKVDGLRRLGARVIQHGATYDEAHEEALRLAAVEGLRYVHAFTERAVIAGQGSVALEILADLPEVACLVVPVGGGGLIGGTALALAGAGRLSVRLVGAQGQRTDAMARSMRAGALVRWRRRGPTLADGLAGNVELLTLELCRRHVHAMVLATEREILATIGSLLRHDHVLAEGSAAVGVAALLHGHVELPPAGPVVAIVSGGNVDTRVAMRALRALRE